MSKLLLDTCAVLWWFDNSDRLSDRARESISDEGSVVYVSPVSAFEIATKHKLGKLLGAENLILNWNPLTGAQYFEDMDVSVADGLLAGSLPLIHKDPFDRLLIAQAMNENAALVSSDEVFDAYGVRRLW